MKMKRKINTDSTASAAATVATTVKTVVKTKAATEATAAAAAAPAAATSVSAKLLLIQSNLTSIDLTFLNISEVSFGWGCSTETTKMAMKLMLVSLLFSGAAAVQLSGTA